MLQVGPPYADLLRSVFLGGKVEDSTPLVLGGKVCGTHSFRVYGFSVFETSTDTYTLHGLDIEPLSCHYLPVEKHSILNSVEVQRCTSRYPTFHFNAPCAFVFGSPLNFYIFLITPPDRTIILVII